MIILISEGAQPLAGGRHPVDDEQMFGETIREF